MMQTLEHFDVSLHGNSKARKFRLSLLGDNISNSFITNLKFIIISCSHLSGTPVNINLNEIMFYVGKERDFAKKGYELCFGFSKMTTRWHPFSFS